MVKTPAKMVLDPLVRIPPKKREFTDSVMPTPLGPPPIPAGGRLPPTPQKLDAHAMMRMIPGLSERDLKQLVSCIVKRRKREGKSTHRRPSEPAINRSARKATPDLLANQQATPAQFDTAPPPKPLWATERVHKERQMQTAVDTKIAEDQLRQQHVHRSEESDLAGALLRQATRQLVLITLFH